MTAPAQPDPDLARFLPVLVELTGRLDADGIGRDTKLDGDLYLDELDRLEIANEAETLFGVDLPLFAEEEWQTVGDILDAVEAARAAAR